MAEPKFKYQNRQQWYPIRLGEALYRCPDGESIYWPVAENNTASSNRLMSIAKSYASRLGISVSCKVGKMIVEDETGTEVVKRVVVLTPTDNQRAIEFAKAVAEGREPLGQEPASPEDAESFVHPKEPPKPAKRRGRPPVIKSEEDRQRWEQEWARRDAAKTDSK